MAGDTLSPELLALQKNCATLCRGITTILTVTGFAQSLEEKSLITTNATHNILHMMGVSDNDKCSRLLQAVKEQVKIDRTKFELLIGILRQEPAFTCHTDILINSRGEGCVYIQIILC